MIVHTYRIPCEYGEKITIKPVFDVHLGNEYCDKRAFKSFLADSDERTYFLGGGDLCDAIGTKDPRYAKHADGTTSHDIIDEQIDEAFEYLEPYKDRIIGLGIGNHEMKTSDYCGTNPIKRLCRRLDVTPLGYSGFVRLILRGKDGGGRTVKIKYHHGWGGGGRTAGGSLTKYEKDMAKWDADVFYYGHDHQRKVDQIERLGIVGDKIFSKPKKIGICGTFLKTFSETVDPTYSELKGYPPVPIGGIATEITVEKPWVKIKMSDDD